MTKEDVESTIMALEAQGMDKAQVDKMREILEQQVRVSELMHEDNEKEHTAQLKKQEQISKIVDAGKGRKYGEAPEKFEERRKKTVEESPDIIPLGRQGRKALVKDEKAATGFTEKKRRKITDEDLKWAEEHEAYKGAHPDEKFDYTPAQQAALRTHEINKKYRPLADKDRLSKRKDSKKGPALTPEELQQFTDFGNQLKDAQWYIPTDDELKKEQQARDAEISIRSAQKYKNFKNSMRKQDSRNTGITVPFHGAGSVIVDFSDENVRDGDIPVQVSSGGKSQAFLVPFQDLLKFRRGLDDWSGNSNLSYTISANNRNGERLSDDEIKKYMHAWNTGDYRETKLPRLMSGVGDKESMQGFGKSYGGPRFGGQGDRYNLVSDYYTNPEEWKKQHQDLVEEAKIAGMSYEDYMKEMAGRADADIAGTSKSLDSAVIEAHKSRNPDKIREAVLSMLQDRLEHHKSKGARAKAEHLINAIRNGSRYESEDALKAGLDSSVNRARKAVHSDIRDTNMVTAKQLRELKKMYDDMALKRGLADKWEDETGRASLYKSLPDEIYVAPEGHIFIMDGDEPVPTGYTAEQIFGDSGIKSLSPYLAASQPEGSEGYAPLQGYNGGDMLRLLRQAPLEGKRGEGFSRPDKNGVPSPLFFETPFDRSSMVKAYRDAYNDMGGDPLMEMLENFDKRELKDIIGDRNMGSMVPELIWDDVLDEAGNPKYDASGKPLKRPRLFLDSNMNRLKDAYRQLGIETDPGYAGKIDRFKRFRMADGAINQDLWHAYRAAVMQAAAEKLKQSQDAAKLDMINSFQEQGGLTNDQIKNNNKILNDVVQAGKFHGDKNIGLAEIAENAAAQLAASQALRKAYTGKVSSLSNIMRHPERVKQFLGIDLPEGMQISKDDIRRIMPLSKYNKSGDGTFGRNQAFDELIREYIKNGGKI